MEENQAAWIKSPKTDVVVEPTQKYTPGTEQVLVKVESIGFNPVEPKIQKYAPHFIEIKDFRLI